MIREKTVATMACSAAAAVLSLLVLSVNVSMAGQPPAAPEQELHAAHRQ